MSAPLHGLAAEFLEAAEVLVAARHAREAGYRAMDAYTPFPVEGLAEEVGLARTGVPLAFLVGGLVGGSLAFLMQSYAAIWDYPLNVGGRPLFSWPSFVPITFELTVLFGSLCGVLSMLALNGLPRLHHPIFNLPHFAERSHSRFYLCIKAQDPLFRPQETRHFLEGQHPAAIWEVPT